VSLFLEHQDRNT